MVKAIRDTNKGRYLAAKIKQCMKFYGCFGLTERRPPEDAETKIDGGGIKSVDRTIDLQREVIVVQI